MNNDNCDLFSIVRSYRATTFTNSSADFETPPQPLLETLTPITTTNNNNIISPVNTKLPYFDNFTVTQKNIAVPIVPLKPNDFIDLNKLRTSFNPTTLISTPTTTSIPTTITATISSFTNTDSTTSLPTHITLNTITNTNTSVQVSNQNSTFYDFPITTICTPKTTMPTSAITTPTITTHTTITPITTFTTPATTISTQTTTTPVMSTATAMTSTSVHGINQYPTISDFPILIERQYIQSNINSYTYFSKPSGSNGITTAHFDCACNHASVAQQLSREHNQPPTLQPQMSFGVLQNTHSQQPKHRSIKKKNNNHVTLVCHVRTDKCAEDQWQWKKYGEKPTKGSPHPRSYYKCRSFKDCPAKKLVEKSKTKKNIYVVTYRGEHNHQKPLVKHKSVVETSWNKSSEVRLPDVAEAVSSPNSENLDLPNEVMLQFDQSKSNNAQILNNHSKFPSDKIGLIESQSHTVDEAGSSQNVRNLDSHNMGMLHFDEQDKSNNQVFADESEIPYSETNFTESSDNDVILIPNITYMTEDILLDFNRLNGGALFP